MHVALTPTMADLIRPQRRAGRLCYDLALIAGGSLLIVLCSRVSFTLPANPAVPVTGQTFAVLLVGALLGARRGALSVLAFIAQGLAGLPVGAQGTVGVAWLLGPTGGYLVGFVAAAYTAGWLAERGWDRSFGCTVAAMSLATALIFVPGVLWLALQARVIELLSLHSIDATSPDRVLMVGLWPYLPGAAIKIILAAVLLPAGWKLLALTGAGPGPGAD